MAAQVEELDAANGRIRRLERERDDVPLVTRNDTAENIARTFMEWLPVSKRHPVASAMMRFLKSTEPQPRVKDKPRETPQVGGLRRAILDSGPAAV